LNTPETTPPIFLPPQRRHHLTDEELEDIEGKNEGRAKAVLEARKASEDAKHKLRVIDGDG
jgi:hypothetical protein